MNAWKTDAVISTEWLANHLEDPGVRVIDATFFLPTVPRDAAREFEDRHIPGAVFFDVDAIADKTIDLPHMLPSAAEFGRAMGALGIGNRHRVVAYDANGVAAAACRAWWTLRVFGHDDVAVLDGGLPKWLAEKRPTEAGSPKLTPETFAAAFRSELVRDRGAMLANLESRAEQVVDARSPGRFAGDDPEPRPAQKAGHIPGSRNLPFNALVDPDAHMTLRSAAEVGRAFTDAGIDPDRPVVASCGSGVTAAVLAFGLFLLGRKDAAVYDGSWAEWGNHDDTPVER